eukprot:TRINITY_DN29362_c0_g1_i1.p1 TRINITY_DN29362_c0_g1~~TRINITY_DN29362_c0_g1_i1.p1  ORF type:complete len:585 (-),score=81.98 TRINITY_DN29362_c0_g1_i1:26-1780(-)
MDAAQNNGVSVTFELQGDIQMREDIRIVGASEELGSWNPESGPLLTMAAQCPTWTATVRFPKANSIHDIADVEYKYVRDRRHQGGDFEWERRPNRCLGQDSPNRQAVGSDCDDLGKGTWLVVDPGLELYRRQQVTFMPTCDVARRDSFETRYKCLEKLGFGSFGTVWRCQHLQEKPKRDFAAKRIDKSKLAQRDAFNLLGSARQEGEVRLHLEQKHPYIVRILEVFDEPTYVTMILEHCHCDLLVYTKHHFTSHKVGLPEHESVAMLNQLLLALTYLHRQRIVHRDVKCENVLLQQDLIPLDRNTCKLCDFGLAARLPSGGLLRHAVGSLDYLAPELLQSSPGYDCAVDFWSAGVILYMVTVGKSPFNATSQAKVMVQIRKAEYSLEGGIWDKTSRCFKYLVRSFMTVDQEKRLAAAYARFVPVTFHLRAEGCRLEDRIRIVGSSVELGGWDPESGVLLTRESHETWTATVQFIKSSPTQGVTEVEYKYVRDLRNQGGRFEWEEPSRKIKLHLWYDSQTCEAPTCEGSWQVRDPGLNQANGSQTWEVDTARKCSMHIGCTTGLAKLLRLPERVLRLGGYASENS